MQIAVSTPSFDSQPRTRLVFGDGVAGRVGELAQSLQARRVLLVTDPGIIAAGHAERVQAALAAAGLEVTLFGRVRENPTTRCVQDCVEVAAEAGSDTLIGLGGGSAMDTAKGCNFLLTNGGRMSDYWGVGKATKPMLPFIAIPTTAGTGSECQCAALIADEATHQKMACLDPKAAARVAILDPLLTLSQPAQVTACTGMDAIAHAVETAVCTRRNPISDLYAREALRLLAGAFVRVLEEPQDLAARGRMLLGAAFAGLAIENSMLGAAHAAANPLTARHDIVHGQAVGLLLPHVVRCNAGDAASAANYEALARNAQIATDAEGLARWLDSVLARAGLATPLADCGVGAADLPLLAEAATRQWTARFNPRPLTAADFERIYSAAL
jgi:alcohol dehydrogenase